jgi:hypothetical protein
MLFVEPYCETHPELPTLLKSTVGAAFELGTDEKAKNATNHESTHFLFKIACLNMSLV